MKKLITSTVITMALSTVFGLSTVQAQERKYAPVPKDVTTVEKINSKIGKLEFPNGYPTSATAAKLEDEILYVHAVEAYLNTIHGISLYAMRKGFREAGINDNEFVVFPNMMDGNQLYLTANMDTYYYMSFIDLSGGPMIVETPVDALGIVDDMWFNWVTDFGLPGSDRGEGGRYLLVPEGYDGPLPDGGYFIRYSKTNHMWFAGRSFLANNSLDKAIKDADVLALYPYSPGGQGTSIGDYLNGEAKLGPPSEYKKAIKIDGTGNPMNTLPPSNYQHFVMLNALIQEVPATAMNPEIGGLAAAIGIEKGKPFNPDEKTKAILNRAVEVGNAYARTAATGALPNKGFDYYGDNSGWWNPLWEGGYTFTTPPPAVGPKGELIPYDYTGARRIAARSSFYYFATGTTPAMVMNLTGIGSQYLMNNVGADGKPLDGGKTYKVTFPKGIPAERFWSVTVYNMQTRSIIQTDQKFPRAGSQSFPTPAAQVNKDGSTTIYYGPSKPDGIFEGNWVQTNANEGWFQLLRIYSPSKPFFDQTWKPGKLEIVK
jgi:hypothetical protein